MIPLDLATTDEERDLEKQIDRATLAMLSARTPSARRGWSDRMRALIGRRSPEMVERMEAAAGLRCVDRGECDGRR